MRPELLAEKEINTEFYFSQPVCINDESMPNSQCYGFTVTKDDNGNVEKEDYHRFLKACYEIILSDFYQGCYKICELDLLNNKTLLYFRFKTFLSLDELKIRMSHIHKNN